MSKKKSKDKRKHKHKHKHKHKRKHKHKDEPERTHESDHEDSSVPLAPPAGLAAPVSASSATSSTPIVLPLAAAALPVTDAAESRTESSLAAILAALRETNDHAFLAQIRTGLRAAEDRLLADRMVGELNQGGPEEARIFEREVLRNCLQVQTMCEPFTGESEFRKQTVVLCFSPSPEQPHASVRRKCHVVVTYLTNRGIAEEIIDVFEVRCGRGAPKAPVRDDLDDVRRRRQKLDSRGSDDSRGGSRPDIVIMSFEKALLADDRADMVADVAAAERFFQANGLGERMLLPVLIRVGEEFNPFQAPAVLLEWLVRHYATISEKGLERLGSGLPREPAEEHLVACHELGVYGMKDDDSDYSEEDLDAYDEEELDEDDLQYLRDLKRVSAGHAEELEVEYESDADVRTHIDDDIECSAESSSDESGHDDDDDEDDYDEDHDQDMSVARSERAAASATSKGGATPPAKAKKRKASMSLISPESIPTKRDTKRRRVISDSSSSEDSDDAGAQPDDVVGDDDDGSSEDDVEDDNDDDDE